ncbi:uncharacterized protein LOC129230179 [Uloborus diversus]|uniref:uncharacterized protein LOC129230179 n=1 Tax=Uloborus diversus TaxID=327109 RepID=UPI002408F53C|nr:uncharacterized protein LOC129230179 [Uloborus diversus]
MNTVNFIQSTPGDKLLIFDNYLYRINKKNNGRTFWKCTLKNYCKARITLKNDVTEKIQGSHDHPPDEGKNLRKEFYHQLKKKSREEASVPVNKIYREELAKFATSLEVASNLPDIRIAEKAMYRARALTKPLIPKSLSDINLTDDWIKTKAGDNFC